VRHIRPSHLDEWLALHEQRLKNTSYNRYAGLVKQLFEIAVKDRIIAESPFEQVTTRWKKPQEPIRCVPTIEQFQAIVDEIRAQRYTKFAAPTADFVEFLGLAGVGQAEAASLTWGDVDWQNERISFRRHKTDARFYVPIIRICGHCSNG
jgi:site-specific recombinase XerD